MSTLAPPEPEVEDRTDSSTEPPWVTVVWNDPVNLMSYVTLVLQELFGYPRKKAHRMMLEVHNRGRCAVSSGSQEQMEADVVRLHARGLWATVAEA